MRPAVKRVAKRTARPEQVYQKLRALIVRGQLAPGARIIETDVAARLGVSRTPVRGALQRLHQEGYVMESPRLQQSRPLVAPLTREDARELFTIVAEIEGLAARETANLTSERREQLYRDLLEVNDDFKRASQAKRPDHNRVWELDETFHRKYVEAAAGPRLLALHDAVKPQAERYERLYVSLLSRDIGVSAAEHVVIAKAIRSGDPDRAQMAVQTNWRNAADRLGTVIESLGERGSW